MSKKFTIVNSEVYSAPDFPGIQDKFRFSFGSWTSNVETKNIFYERNDRSHFTLEDYVISKEEFYKLNEKYKGLKDPKKDSNFSVSNHMIIVPTRGFGSVPYLEEVHRLSFYLAKSNKGNSLFSLINYGIRHENYVSSFDLPNNNEDNLNFENSNQSIFSQNQTVGTNILDTAYEVSVDFLYKTENIKYESISDNAATEYALPNYYEILESLKTSEDTTAEQFIVSSVGEYQSSVGRRERFAKILIAPDRYSETIEYGNSLFNTIRDIDYLDTHRGIKGSYQKEKSIEGLPNIVKIRIDKSSYDFDLSSNARNTDNNYMSSKQKSNKIMLDNFMFFKRDTPNKNDFDIGLLLMRWHTQFSNVLNSLPRSNTNFVSSRQSTTIGQQNILENQSFYNYDFFKWLLEHAPSLIGEYPSNMSVYGSTSDSSDLATVNRSELFEIKFVISKIIESFCYGMLPGSINIETLADRYVSLYNKLYTYKEMVKCGGNGDSEVLFYKIEKFNGTNTNIKPLQTFMIPNVFDSQTEYIDTQVKYGTQYTYRISEVRAMLGSEYEYVELEQPQSVSTKNNFIFGVRQYPRLKIIEIPIYEKAGSIIGDPPLVPQFQLFPVRRKKNKFKLFFEPSYGEVKETPISVTSVDSALYNTLKQQTRNSFGQILFSSKSKVNRYEVYYSEVSPDITLKTKEQIYSSFFESLYTFVETDSDLTTPINADSATIQLNLTPNKKYYFTFIARNRLGVSSNPTNIYEVEMINDSGYSYPVIKPMEFVTDKIPEFKKNTKTLNKLISIKASYIQASLNTLNIVDSSGNPKDLKGIAIKPGPLGETGIFPISEPKNTESQAIRDGKKFKLRFTSKNSGKSFDINVTFKHNGIQSPFDIKPIDQPFTSIPIDRSPVGTSGRNQSIPQSTSLKNISDNYSCRYSSDNPVPGYYYPEVGTSPSMIAVPFNNLPIEENTPTIPPSITGPPNIMKPPPPDRGDELLYNNSGLQTSTPRQ